MVPVPFHTTVRQGDLLGPGHLGATWAAEGPDGEHLVVKRLAGLAPAEAEAKEMAERVAVLPGCVAPVGVEARNGDLWILYPFIHGAGPVEAAATIGPSLGADLEQAVARLHAAGLVHGALHDANVRVTADGEVLLLDTGLAGLGAVGAVGAATAQTDRRDLAALLERMAARPDRVGERRRAGPAALVLVVIVVVVILAPVEMARAGRGGAAVAAAHLARHATRAHPSPSASRCATGSLPGLDGATYLAVDMTGSGCAEPMAWAAGVISTVSADGAPMRFSLGGHGDVLLVGHWFCSRAELPALYRRATGQVFYIPAWPVDGGVVSSGPAVETGIRDGTARSAVSGGCARVEVRR
ncbi:MAG TPA: hypothetical protein VFH50_03905 [Acidimicrobiales bacterium]|nr:hypothetical protein [Acidimicrobiales bacterium]